MNKRNFGRLGLVVVALLFALTPILGCAPQVAPPPAEEVYKPEVFMYYVTGDLSGPIGMLNIAMPPSLEDYCEWVNTERGGIRGVPVGYECLDNGYDIATGVANYEHFRSQVPKPIVGSFHPTDITLALLDRCAEDHILNFQNGPDDKQMFPVGWTMSSAPSYVSSTAVVFKMVRERWPAEVPVKVALLTWDNAYGRGIFRPELREWFAEQEGIELVAEEVFSPRDTDVSTQLKAIQAAGANWVYDNTLGMGPIVISKSAAAMGILAHDIDDVTPGKIHRATGVWGVDETVALVGGEVMEGLIGVRNMASFDETENPGVKKLIEIADMHNRPPEVRTMAYIQTAFGKLDLVLYHVGELVDEYGWEGVTGDNLRERMLNTKKYKAFFGLQTFSYSPDYPMNMTGKIYQIIGGKILPVTGLLDFPDLRPKEYR